MSDDDDEEEEEIGSATFVLDMLAVLRGDAADGSGPTVSVMLAGRA